MVLTSLAIAALLVSSCVAAVPSGSNYHCSSFIIPVNVSVNTTQLKVTAPRSQIELTGLVQETFSLDSNVSTELVGGKTPLVETYHIWSQLCIPEKFSNGGILEFAVHGINLDHSYWEIGGQGSVFNFVEAAVAAGHAIFTFDRLGTGLSSTPDGIREVQTATHIEIIAELVAALRRGIADYSFGQIVGIGHSYGSYVLAGLVATQGNVLDSLVLTGFSTFTGSFPAVFAGLGLGIAAELNSTRFGTLPSSYMSVESNINLQQMFFLYPEFPPTLLDFTGDHKGVFTIGELLTIGESLGTVASEFTGSVLVVTGAKDFVVCGGNCFDKSVNLLQGSVAFFPAASNLTISSPARTGHNINGHFSAPEVFRFIMRWITERA